MENIKGIFLELRPPYEHTISMPSPDHITLLYVGKSSGKEDKVLELGSKYLHKFIGKRVVLTKAIYNTFYHEETGKHRTDILQLLDDETTKLVKDTQDEITELIGVEPSCEVPHVTLKYNVEKDYDLLDEINEMTYPEFYIITGISFV